MLGEDLDAASTAYRVGYHNAAQFNRDYKSLFGAPPIRDVQRLREEVLADLARGAKSPLLELWGWKRRRRSDTVVIPLKKMLS